MRVQIIVGDKHWFDGHVWKLFALWAIASFLNGVGESAYKHITTKNTTVECTGYTVINSDSVLWCDGTKRKYSWQPLKRENEKRRNNLDTRDRVLSDVPDGTDVNRNPIK